MRKIIFITGDNLIDNNSGSVFDCEVDADAGFGSGAPSSYNNLTSLVNV